MGPPQNCRPPCHLTSHASRSAAGLNGLDGPTPRPDDAPASAPAAAKAKEEEEKSQNPIVRAWNRVLDFLNSTALQTILYLIFVGVFQSLTETLRAKEEYYFDKMVTDTFIENHFDSSHNTFESVRRTADIWEWGNNVLWPGFFANGGPCADVGLVGGMPVKGCNDDVWPDGDGSFHGAGATAYTAAELARRMDQLDWTEGIIIRQTRAKTATDEVCGTQTLDVCLPELGSNEQSGMTRFGYNWTHPGEKLTHDWEYFDSTALGGSPAGVQSAAIPSMRTFETGGFIALVIPFFTDTWMDEESGTHEEVTDFKKYRVTRENNKTPKYYCVRLSHNGKHIRQLCDPTDDTDPDSPTYRMGRNTGVVRQAVEEWWNDLKRGHYLDEYTRSMVLQLQLRSNHLGVRFRITLMFELTSLGSIMPSYDFETRTEDIFRYNNMFFLCNIALGITGFFCALEGIELIKSGPQEYFSDMWNVMDWLNFSIFILVYINIRALTVQEDDFEHRKICEVCQSVGYKDDWQVMGTIRNIKLFLSLCVCIQLL